MDYNGSVTHAWLRWVFSRYGASGISLNPAHWGQVVSCADRAPEQTFPLVVLKTLLMQDYIWEKREVDRDWTVYGYLTPSLISDQSRRAQGVVLSRILRMTQRYKIFPPLLRFRWHTLSWIRVFPMEDFSMYNIPYAQIDWHSIQPTFFTKSKSSERQVPEEARTSAVDPADDLNYENTRPVSAYAMFFKERQIVAKKLFPNATFGDISRIVAAEWDSLGAHQKSAYKRRNEQLRRMHIKMAAKERVQRICSSMGKTYKEGTSDEKRARRDVKPLATRQNSQE